MCYFLFPQPPQAGPNIGLTCNALNGAFFAAPHARKAKNVT
jgi:hypothetical protein